MHKSDFPRYFSVSRKYVPVFTSAGKPVRLLSQTIIVHLTSLYIYDRCREITRVGIYKYILAIKLDCLALITSSLYSLIFPKDVTVSLDTVVATNRYKARPGNTVTKRK